MLNYITLLKYTGITTLYNFIPRDKKLLKEKEKGNKKMF